MFEGKAVRALHGHGLHELLWLGSWMLGTGLVSLAVWKALMALSDWSDCIAATLH